ncbi:MAG: cob(I)yrinic acid a,c-diamide adenosyltransferase [Thermodesulfobacteriota bacterium]
MNEGMLIVYTGQGPEREMPSLGLLVRSAGYGKKGCIIDFGNGSSDPERRSAEIMGDSVDIFPQTNAPLTVEDAWNTAKTVIREGSHQLVILRGLPKASASGRIPEQDMRDCLAHLPPDVNVIVVGNSACRPLIDLADVVTDVREISPR